MCSEPSREKLQGVHVIVKKGPLELKKKAKKEGPEGLRALKCLDMTFIEEI